MSINARLTRFATAAIVGGAAVLLGADAAGAAGLVDVNGLLRLLDVGDLYPF